MTPAEHSVSIEWLSSATIVQKVAFSAFTVGWVAGRASGLVKNWGMVEVGSA